MWCEELRPGPGLGEATGLLGGEDWVLMYLSILNITCIVLPITRLKSLGEMIEIISKMQIREFSCVINGNMLAIRIFCIFINCWQICH